MQNYFARLDRLRPGFVFLLDPALRYYCQSAGLTPTSWILIASVSAQRMALGCRWGAPWDGFTLVKRFRISTSRFGINSVQDSNGTPLGLHRIAEKIGAGWPVGTVFKARQPVGYTWQGMPDGAITNRIFWLEGLQPGQNRGSPVDSHARYIYIHGVGDETTLGRPASRGCIHMSGSDLLPLFDQLPSGTWVWIVP